MALVISDKRIAANQRNAALSTGPKTEAGKAKSRGNALKHGLSAIQVGIEDEATIHDRAIGVHETIRPQTKFQVWLCIQIAVRTIRLDRLRVLERDVRIGAAWRAENVWDEDQRNEAEQIAARLPRDPSRTVGQLRRSVQGTDWLIDRWAILAEVADRQPWNAEQKSLANDLLGTPRQLRDDAPEHGVDTFGHIVAPGLSAAQLARRMLAELNHHRDLVAEADELARTLAIADCDDFNNRDLIRLRRYERSLINDLHRFYAMSQHESPHTVAKSKLTQSIPAEFFEPALTAALEPPALEPAAVEPELIMEVSPTVQNEPIVVVQPTVQNEPIVVVQPTVQNEPIVVVQPTVQNEPIVTASQPFPPMPTGLSPELVALLEADLPDLEALDPSFCRDYVRTMLGSGRFAEYDDLNSLLDLDPNGRNQ